MQSAKASNPHFSLGPKLRFGSYLESVIYHELLRNPETMTASVEWIKIFFCKSFVKTVG